MTKRADIENIETTDGTITIVREIVDVEPREADLSMWTIEEQQPIKIGNPESFMEDMLDQELIENN